MKDSSKPEKKRRIALPDKKIAERIRSLRLELNYSQKALADYLNISQRQIAEYESCKIRVSAQTLQRIAEFLHKPVSYFYGEDQDILMRLEKKIDFLFDLFITSDGKIKDKLEISNNIGLRDFLLSKNINNSNTINDLEVYFRFACERDGFNFDKIWYT